MSRHWPAADRSLRQREREVRFVQCWTLSGRCRHSGLPVRSLPVRMLPYWRHLFPATHFDGTRGLPPVSTVIPVFVIAPEEGGRLLWRAIALSSRSCLLQSLFRQSCRRSRMKGLLPHQAAGCRWFVFHPSAVAVWLFLRLRLEFSYRYVDRSSPCLQRLILHSL